MSYRQEFLATRTSIGKDTWPSLVSDTLYEEGFSKEKVQSIIDCYREPHRFYHTCYHIWYLAVKIMDLNITNEEKSILYIAAAYHDIVYNPKHGDGVNEKKSIERFRSDIIGTYLEEPGNDLCDVVCNIIFVTAFRTRPEKRLEQIFWDMDNSILSAGLTDLLGYENNIFREFQYVAYEDYAEKRIEFLKTEFDRNDNVALLALIDYIIARKPRVGLYIGSFDDFHIGHKNILEKAEQIFDKVILAKCINPDKDPSFSSKFPESLLNREIYYWSGLTTSLIKSLSESYDVTLVRGLRNGTDLDYETNQLRYNERMLPDIKVCYIQCDAQFGHVSSKWVKALGKFSVEEMNYYLVK